MTFYHSLLLHWILPISVVSSFLSSSWIATSWNWAKCPCCMRLRKMLTNQPTNPPPPWLTLGCIRFDQSGFRASRSSNRIRVSKSNGLSGRPALQLIWALDLWYQQPDLVVWREISRHVEHKIYNPNIIPKSQGTPVRMSNCSGCSRSRSWSVQSMLRTHRIRNRQIERGCSEHSCSGLVKSNAPWGCIRFDQSGFRASRSSNRIRVSKSNGLSGRPALQLIWALDLWYQQPDLVVWREISRHVEHKSEHNSQKPRNTGSNVKLLGLLEVQELERPEHAPDAPNPEQTNRTGLLWALLFRIGQIECTLNVTALNFFAKFL